MSILHKQSAKIILVQPKYKIVAVFIIYCPVYQFYNDSAVQLKAILGKC